MNIHYPKTKGNGLPAWYTIYYRLQIAPIIYGGIAIAAIGVFLIGGYRLAIMFWKDTT